jgi:hypothetical protein
MLHQLDLDHVKILAKVRAPYLVEQRGQHAHHVTSHTQVISLAHAQATFCPL